MIALNTLKTHLCLTWTNVIYLKSSHWSLVNAMCKTTHATPVMAFITQVLFDGANSWTFLPPGEIFIVFGKVALTPPMCLFWRARGYWFHAFGTIWSVTSFTCFSKKVSTFSANICAGDFSETRSLTRLRGACLRIAFALFDWQMRKVSWDSVRTLGGGQMTFLCFPKLAFNGSQNN